MRLLCWAICALLASACREAKDAAPDSTPQVDAPHAIADQGTAPDLGLGDSFGLSIAVGTQACSLFLGGGFATAPDLLQEYPLKGRITFKPGLVHLARDQASFAADWIAKLELGPERAEAQPNGPGMFTRTIEGTPDEAKYRYGYTRSYALQGQTYTLRFSGLSFAVKGGTCLQPLVNGPFVFQISGTLGTDAGASAMPYASCRYEGYQQILYQLAAENGDTVELTERLDAGEQSGIICTVCPAALVKAVFKRGAEQREVTDHFRLAYSAAHHNWLQQFLVVLDQPLGGASALFIKESEIDGLSAASELLYLDQQLRQISSSKLTQYERK